MGRLSWNSVPAEFNAAPPEEILIYFNSLPTPSGQCAGIRRLSYDISAKKGVRKCEYDNQLFVWQLVNSNEVRIPKPFRFFEDRDTYGLDTGYLLMEHLHGTSIASDSGFQDEDVIDKVARAICFLHTKSSGIMRENPRPGPISGGLAEGFPWGEHPAEQEFITASDLEESIMRRLKRSGRARKERWTEMPLNFKGQSFALCHLDLSPRNIILMGDGGVGLLDWATMAYYPRIFELAALSFSQVVAEPTEKWFFEGLERRLKTWRSEDEDEIARLEYVQQISISHTL